MTADFQPTSRQSDATIAQLTKNLASYDLTKAEKLQIVNLAPTEAVELYVVSISRCLSPFLTYFLSLIASQIVEELEDRLGDKMQDILDTVQASLIAPASSDEAAQPQDQEMYHNHGQPAQLAFSAEDVEGWADEQEFVHEEGNLEDAIGDIDEDVE